MSSIKIGIWMGYIELVRFENEGIGRSIYYILNYLLKNFNLEFEIWCYEINKKEIEKYYLDGLLSSNYKKKVKIFTENINEGLINSFLYYWKCDFNNQNFSWKKLYKAFVKSNENSKFHIRFIVKILSLFLIIKGIYIKRLYKLNILKIDNNIINDQLAKRANKISQARCFIIPIVSLDNALEISKPKIVMFYDLVTFEFYDLFIKNYPTDKKLFDRGKKNAEDFIKQNAKFLSISQYVIDKHFLKFLDGADESKIDFVYQANMTTPDLQNKIMELCEIRNKYGLDQAYIFFPSQLRPHKNVITLLRSLKILLSRGIDIKLILTGNLEHNKESYEYMIDNSISKNIVYASNVSEIELYSLYKYASAMVSPSLFEGGFPLQALEAFVVETPVIIANIPVTVERLKSVGFDDKNHGLELFDAEDELALAEIINNVINNRDEYVKKQKNARDRLLSYTWDDAAKCYYDNIIKVVSR